MGIVLPAPNPNPNSMYVNQDSIIVSELYNDNNFILLGKPITFTHSTYKYGVLGKEEPITMHLISCSIFGIQETASDYSIAFKGVMNRIIKRLYNWKTNHIFESGIEANLHPIFIQ